ncbi:MAG: hypothetical protein O2820_14970 [Planctomycetota bacterium]|nr:hypothetical protein [Planctomycetota bacterium]MDA1250516.1 hypothetical protein [Planctomycetota bacterium]
MRRSFAKTTTVLTLVFAGGASAFAADPTPASVFDARILPIFRSSQPSSCVQCHLSSVDLKQYILPSHEKTFLSLRDQGLVDLKEPKNSKILTLISMGEKDLDKGAKLIHEKMRKAEYDAFAGWIEACSKDESLCSLPPLTEAERAQPEHPVEVIRHARKSRLVDSFVRTVYSQRFRCFPCHTPHDIDPTNPQHQAPMKNMKKFKEEYPQVVERMDIFKETPEATLAYLIERSRKTHDGDVPMLDLRDPKNSLLVLKPLSKLPPKGDDGKLTIPRSSSTLDAMSHMGGLKMHRDDQSYKSFVAWIQDYSKVVQGQYKSVEELPADNWFGSQLMVRVLQTPDEWKAGTPVQLFVHAWNAKTESWAPKPIAFTQGTVTPKHMVNGALFLLAPDNRELTKDWSRETAKLPRGRYLVKAFVDSHHKLAKDPTVILGEGDFYGQAEIRSARWREGFRQAETIDGGSLK